MIRPDEQREPGFRFHEPPAQKMIPPSLLTIQGRPVVFYHVAGAMIGRIVDPAGERIALQLFRYGCDCGCNNPGVGVFVTPDVETARLLAGALTEYADRFEARATEQAAAALARAAGQ